MYIKFTKTNGSYKIETSGAPTKGSNKIIRKYVESLSDPISSIPQFIKT